jgi:hypothetical protein
MAADAAFSQRPDTSTRPPVKVTVLRKRGVEPAGFSRGDSTPSRSHDRGDGDPSARASRVFTLRPAPVSELAARSDSEPVDLNTPAKAEPARRRRGTDAGRIGHDTRARLIRHVHLAPAAQAARPQADTSPIEQPERAAARTKAADTLFSVIADDPAFESETPAALMRMLGRIERLLDEARAARALSFVGVEP